jgi:hypothetical protein
MMTEKGKHAAVRFLGLDPEKHTDEQIETAINNAYSDDEIKDLENRAKQYDDLRKELVQADLKEFANRIGTDEKAVKYWTEALFDNREGAIAALKALPEPKTTAGKGAPLHDPNKAGQPKPLDNRGGEDKAQQAKKQALISNRAQKLQSESNMPPGMAWVRASEEIEAEASA